MKTKKNKEFTVPKEVDAMIDNTDTTVTASDTQEEVTPQVEAANPQPQFQELTLARALNEVKVITKRLDKLSQVSSFCKVKKGTVETVSDATDFLAHVQTIQSLIERRANIKNAINLANSQTVVTVKQYQLTISAALAMKEGISYQQLVSNLAKSNYINTKRSVDNENAKAETRLAQLLESNFSKDKKADSNDYDAIAEPFNSANLSSIVDEPTLLANMELYSNIVQEFADEVDFALSEANALTKIRIPV